jgi:acetate kinase
MSTILTVNRGSSSLKLAAFEKTDGGALERIVSASAPRIDTPGAKLTVSESPSGKHSELALDSANDPAVDCLDRLATIVDFRQVVAVGHRIVHGGPRYAAPERVSSELLSELKRISSYAPEHLPPEIALIEACAARLGAVPQFAAFDTAFHRQMPRVARQLPIPRAYEQQGVERYGFHGLSYEYLMSELARINPRAASGRVILAHLGAGASMAAVLGGKSIDTSMAFTPTAGLPMATRSGDLDPGLVAYFHRAEGMTPAQFDEMANRRSGLLGISEISGDMQTLLARAESEKRARETIALFCYQAKKWIGAYTAALGGLDALVFAGGIGEHAAEIRRQICDGLQCMGIELDPTANAANRQKISATTSTVDVHVIATDEELMIARSCVALL